MLVGRSEDLPWFAASAQAAGQLAGRFARSLLRRGETAAILVLNEETHQLAISISFGGCPVLVIDTTSPDVVAVECLTVLARIPSSGKLSQAARIADALTVEGLGSRFFSAFEHQLERMADAINDLPGRENRRSLALLQMNRLLFLYFVQSKGWLDGREDFLRNEVDRCLGGKRNLHTHLLKPLFFGTLNREIHRRTCTASAFGRVPFLNGGLFEPHPLEKQWRGGIPNVVWRDVFDHLFERFRFTVTEGETSAIAPDMLGRVFEGVMAPAERRDSGTFYTPPALVHQLIDAALTALIVERQQIAPDEARARITRHDPTIQKLLAGVTLLDPAVGSGAFLLGALERLADIRRCPDQPSARLRRGILLENLFGVDINPTAVRLTELRLWLAVIAEDPAEQPEAVEPLPNIDCLVRQGDSLTDPLALIARMPFRAVAMGESLGQLRQVFVSATGQDKREAARALRAAEQDTMRACLAAADAAFERRIRELIHAAEAPDLFGVRGRGQGTTQRIRELRGNWSTVRQARRRFEREGTIPWFQYESHFGDVFASNGGFDVVVGNPPWVRAEQLPRAVREGLRERYRWWRAGDVPREGYRHQPDLAVAFLERAHELAAPAGIVAMLIPSKMATAEYGTAARRALARDLTLHLAADLSSEARIFEATTYPMALVTAKTRPAMDHQVQLGFSSDAPRLPQDRMRGGSPWVLKHTGAAGIAREIATRFPPLGEHFGIHLGVKTGANEVFLKIPDSIEPEVVRPAFRGRDVAPFRVAASIPILWPYTPDGKVMECLPAQVRKHFREFESTLRARTDYKSGPPWTLFRTAPATAPIRVVWADLARQLMAVALVSESSRGFIPLNTCYVMPVRTGAVARAVTAWLNSTWIRAMARLSADPASGGFARFNASSIGRLPLPPSVAGDTALSAITERAERGDFTQDQLDECAATHIGLTSEQGRHLAAVAGTDSSYRR
jgi:hypothetical protein